MRGSVSPLCFLCAQTRLRRIKSVARSRSWTLFLCQIPRLTSADCLTISSCNDATHYSTAQKAQHITTQKNTEQHINAAKNREEKRIASQHITTTQATHHTNHIKARSKTKNTTQHRTSQHITRQHERAQKHKNTQRRSVQKKRTQYHTHHTPQHTPQHKKYITVVIRGHQVLSPHTQKGTKACSFLLTPGAKAGVQSKFKRLRNRWTEHI